MINELCIYDLCIYNCYAAQNSEILKSLKISNSISILIINDIIVYATMHKYTDLFNLIQLNSGFGRS
jgi:DNA-directed RNA polymerase